MQAGLDSAFGPPLGAAQAARDAGVAWSGGYLGGPGAYHAWSPDEWAILRAAGLRPLPIWVCSYGMTESPANAAAGAVAAADAAGIHYGAIVLDTEAASAGHGNLRPFVDEFMRAIANAHRGPACYTGADYLAEPSWRPLWGTSTEPLLAEAIQYGPAVRYGVSVDVNLAGDRFPLGDWTTPGPPTLQEAITLLAKPVCALVATPTGAGYWLIAEDGGVFNFGDAAYLGSEAKIALAAPVVAADRTPDGKGLWLAGADGGVLTLGDATFHGSVPK